MRIADRGIEVLSSPRRKAVVAMTSSRTTIRIVESVSDLSIISVVQAHNYWGGLISYFNADRGGQAYAYKPELP